MIIYGEYSERGYMVTDDRGVCLYTGGNAPMDSGALLAVDDPQRVPLRRIRSYCVQTTHEIVREHKAQYGGVERVTL